MEIVQEKLYKETFIKYQNKNYNRIDYLNGNYTWYESIDGEQKLIFKSELETEYQKLVNK